MAGLGDREHPHAIDAQERGVTLQLGDRVSCALGWTEIRLGARILNRDEMRRLPALLGPEPVRGEPRFRGHGGRV